MSQLFQPGEEARAEKILAILAEVAGYAVSQSVIAHENGASIRSAVELGVNEFGLQMIARLKQIESDFD